MAKSIAEAARDVADYIEKKSVFNVLPGVHESADLKRQAIWEAQQKVAADTIRAFAARSEFEPVTIVAFRALIEALIVPDQVRLPVEWAIYDRYGA
jgi:hypothetical protein